MSLWENDAGAKCPRTAGQWIAHDTKASSFNKFFDLFAVQWILLCNFTTDIASAELPFGYANRAVSHGGPVWMRIVGQLKLTKMYEHIVLNEPRASMEGLYDAEKSFWNIDADFLNNVVIKWTDWHTDYLFHRLQDSRIRNVRFPYSRFIVDAERLWNDPMESIGQGIVYKEFEDYRRNIPSDQEQHLLNLWHWHQGRLRHALQEGALLLDCHSFPDDLSDVDICIGYNEDWSKPSDDIIDMAVNHFMDRGYKVGVNYPYSNSETPDCDFGYHSLMLEVNKKTYLKPGSILLQDDGLRDDITAFQQRLLTGS